MNAHDMPMHKHGTAGTAGEHQAEQALRGAFPPNNSALDAISLPLKLEYFSEAVHGRSYGVIVESAR